jgi:SAM-dependent methyltransferase
MRLNVCAGRHLLDGWTNIDVAPSPHKKAGGRPPDILADMRSIPLPDGCADEVMCIHGIEHIEPWEADVALLEWHRLLMPGGMLVLECPNLLKCCQNVLENYHQPGKHPDQFGMWGLFGDATLRDPYMLHRWAYTPASLEVKLKAAGFVDAIEEVTQWHLTGQKRRDMRMTARKPSNG